MDTNARLCATANLPLHNESTAEEARRLGVPESVIWNARKSGDSIIRTPARDTRALIEEIVWWHNAVNHSGLSYESLFQATRMRHVVYARADAMKRLREVKGWSFPRIAQFFGGLDHTTVMHHVKRPAMAVRPATKLQLQIRIALREAKVGRKVTSEVKNEIVASH